MTQPVPGTRHWSRHLRLRPSLTTGLVLALGAFAIALRSLHVTTALLVAWDIGVIAYGLVFTVKMRRWTVEGLRSAAAELDEGNWGILGFTITASVAALAAIIAELMRAHGKPGAGLAGMLGIATVLLSWFFIHTIFATHYAHQYWRDADGDGRGEGLKFPGNDRPDYMEFLYFSFCMGVASQVSDVSTETAQMRKLVLAHSLVAYLFNTAIIALGVNVAASLAS